MRVFSYITKHPCCCIALNSSVSLQGWYSGPFLKIILNPELGEQAETSRKANPTPTNPPPAFWSLQEVLQWPTGLTSENHFSCHSCIRCDKLVSKLKERSMNQSNTHHRPGDILCSSSNLPQALLITSLTHTLPLLLGHLISPCKYDKGVAWIYTLPLCSLLFTYCKYFCMT